MPILSHRSDYRIVYSSLGYDRMYRSVDAIQL